MVRTKVEATGDVDGRIDAKVTEMEVLIDKTIDEEFDGTNDVSVTHEYLKEDDVLDRLEDMYTDAGWTVTTTTADDGAVTITLA